LHQFSLELTPRCGVLLPGVLRPPTLPTVSGVTARSLVAYRSNQSNDTTDITTHRGTARQTDTTGQADRQAQGQKNNGVKQPVRTCNDCGMLTSSSSLAWNSDLCQAPECQIRVTAMRLHRYVRIACDLSLPIEWSHSIPVWYCVIM